MYFSNVIRFFTEMSAGDIVLVPGRGGVHSGVHAGVIEGELSDASLITTEHYRQKVYSHNIKWIRHDLTRGQFSEEVFNRITRPPVVKQISETAEKRNVYENVFDSFVLGDLARPMIFGRAYDGKGPTATNGINQVIKFLISAQHCLELGNKGDLMNATSMDDITEKYHYPALYV